MTPVEEIIRVAIRERRPVVLEYGRDTRWLRVVHPHVLYRASTGAVCVDAYQVKGYTAASRALPGWRAFGLNHVVSADLLDARFTRAPDYNPAAGARRGAWWPPAEESSSASKPDAGMPLEILEPPTSGASSEHVERVRTLSFILVWSAPLEGDPDSSWIIEVYDKNERFLAIAVQPEAQDALMTVFEDLVPPGEPK